MSMPKVSSLHIRVPIGQVVQNVVISSIIVVTLHSPATAPSDLPKTAYAHHLPTIITITNQAVHVMTCPPRDTQIGASIS